MRVYDVKTKKISRIDSPLEGAALAAREDREIKAAVENGLMTEAEAKQMKIALAAEKEVRNRGFKLGPSKADKLT